ncbi:hypothetical protein MNBD_BACTEROID05-259, partial [hydrothermal vent metagenome]
VESKVSKGEKSLETTIERVAKDNSTRYDQLREFIRAERGVMPQTLNQTLEAISTIPYIRQLAGQLGINPQTLKRYIDEIEVSWPKTFVLEPGERKTYEFISPRIMSRIRAQVQKLHERVGIRKFKERRKKRIPKVRGVLKEVWKQAGVLERDVAIFEYLIEVFGEHGLSQVSLDDVEGALDNTEYFNKAVYFYYLVKKAFKAKKALELKKNRLRQREDSGHDQNLRNQTSDVVIQALEDIKTASLRQSYLGKVLEALGIELDGVISSLPDGSLKVFQGQFVIQAKAFETALKKALAESKENNLSGEKYPSIFNMMQSLALKRVNVGVDTSEKIKFVYDMYYRSGKEDNSYDTRKSFQFIRKTKRFSMVWIWAGPTHYKNSRKKNNESGSSPVVNDQKNREEASSPLFSVFSAQRLVLDGQLRRWFIWIRGLLDQNKTSQRNSIRPLQAYLLLPWRKDGLKFSAAAFSLHQNIAVFFDVIINSDR